MTSVLRPSGAGLFPTALIAGTAALLEVGLFGVAVFASETSLHPNFTLSFLSSAATLVVIAGLVSARGMFSRAVPRKKGEYDIPVILNAMPFAALLTDQDMRPYGMNDAARDLVGLPTSQRVPSMKDLPPALTEALTQAFEHLEPGNLSTILARRAASDDREWQIRCKSYSADRLLWQIDLAASDGDDEIDAALAVVSIAPDGVIFDVSAPAKVMLDGLTDHIDNVAPRGLPASGRTAEIQTVHGTQRVLVTDLPPVGEGRRVSLVPLVGDAGSRDAVRSDWDRFDNLPVPLLWLSADGRVQRANASALALIGPECGPGARLGDLTEGLGRPINDWLDETLAGHRSNSPEFLRVTASDSETFVQIMLKPMTEGGETSLLAVLSDATELKSLEAQFVQSQKMQAIGQLAGGVAHDFNNLLTAISGHCDLLLLRHDQGDPDYADLMQINQNANRAAALVSQLLAFSRKQTLRPVEVDMRETVSDLTHLLNRLVGEKITLSFSQDPVLQSIRADKRQLEQVLMNLVVNARDAIPGSGEIRIVTESVSYQTVFTRDRVSIPPGDYVSVKVIDTGCGIAPERLSKVFEPFYTTKRIGEGTGLGLSTAYGIIKQTGGYIFVDSTLGQGTCFTLLFRAYKDEQKIMDDVKDQTKTSARHADGVVLLVEDEAPVRAFASRALRLRGYTVHEAESGEEALELLSDPDTHVDIFVSDVVMPGMDGPTWVRKALETRPDVRVIFVSGYAEENFGDEQSSIPNSVFLPKPFSLAELTQTVQGVTTT